MDWDWAIERNSEALKGIVEALFAMLGLAGDSHGGADSALPPPRRAAGAPARRIRRAAPCRHRGTRPCGEARAFASHAGGANHRQGRALRVPPFSSSIRGKTSQARAARASTRIAPRIHFFGSDPRVAALWSAPQPAADPAPPPDGLVNAERLTRRLQALKFALEDLPRQARRLARWRLRRENVPGLKFRSPLRPGHPPGHRKKPIHEVDEVLAECHGLAWDALKPDTSPEALRLYIRTPGNGITVFTPNGAVPNAH